MIVKLKDIMLNDTPKCRSVVSKMIVRLKNIMLNDTPKCRSAVSRMAHRPHKTHKTHKTHRPHRPHYENALCSTTLQSVGVGGPN